MVEGLARFRDHFRGFESSFVLIGGAACDLWMAGQGLAFRRTKDLDIVLVVESLDDGFAERFYEFVDAGKYQKRQRPEADTWEFYRFFKPEEEGFPYMLELFSRAPSDMELFPGQHVTPVPADEAGLSLSAILLDEDYYQIIQDVRRDAEGVPVVDARGLIPLKARAFLDMRERKEAGGQVDDNDIRKHRNDVFRLALTLTEGDGAALPPTVERDLRRFLDTFPSDAEEWTAIRAALKATVRAVPAPADLLAALHGYFGLS